MNIPVNVTIEHKVNRSSSCAWMTDHMPPVITLYTWIHFCLQLLNLKNFCLRDWNLIKTCKGLSISSGCWCQDRWMVKRIITEDVQNFTELQFVLLCQVLRLYDQQEHMRGRISLTQVSTSPLSLSSEMLEWSRSGVLMRTVSLLWISPLFVHSVKFVSPSKKFPTQTSCSPAEQPSSPTLKW